MLHRGGKTQLSRKDFLPVCLLTHTEQDWHFLLQAQGDSLPTLHLLANHRNGVDQTRVVFYNACAMNQWCAPIK